jgi:ribosomal-protein-alanine N-acetyltransferase
MTPVQLAALHARVFTTPRPWSAAEFAALLADPLVFLLTGPAGFLLGRVVAGEAELLTLAVAPEARRQGTGARLVQGFLQESARRGAESAFLEVAAPNAAARALYAAAGFAEAGRRRNYYRSPEGGAEDALILVFAFSRPA